MNNEEAEDNLFHGHFVAEDELDSADIHILHTGGNKLDHGRKEQGVHNRADRKDIGKNMEEEVADTTLEEEVFGSSLEVDSEDNWMDAESWKLQSWLALCQKQLYL